MRENTLSQRARQPYGGASRYKTAALLSNLRDDVGIVPYALERILPFNRAWPKVSGFFPSSVPGCARSTFPVGEGDLRRGKATSRRGKATSGGRKNGPWKL